MCYNQYVINMKIKKYSLSLLLFFFLFFLTYYFIFKDYSFNELLVSLKNIKPIYVIYSIIAMALWAFFESLYLKRMLYHLGYKVGFYKAFGYVFTECYFSAVTPSSIGGQPVQMVEMSKDGIPYRVNSILILLTTLIYKITLLFLAVIGFVLYKDDLFTFNNLFNILAILGFITTILLCIFFIILVYSKKLMPFLIKIVFKLMHLLHFKNVKEKEEKLLEAIDGYKECAEFTRRNPQILVESFFILLCQRLSVLIISVFIYLGFGLSRYSIMEVLSFQVWITIAVDFTPFPGGVLISENLLNEANKVLYGGSLATSGMIILRAISFYGIVLFAFIYYLFFHYLKRKPCTKL